MTAVHFHLIELSRAFLGAGHTDLVQVNGPALVNKIHIELKGRAAVCIHLNWFQV